jgi:aspartokinase/homoserine dehydrogenase 1
VVNEADAKETERIIGIEFLYEFQQNLLAIKKISNQSVIALIGNGIKQSLGSFGKVLILLEQNHIKINGLVHHTGECNISLIVNSNQSHHSLKIIHDSIFSKQS